MSSKLFKETEKVRVHIQLSKPLKEALEPYLSLNETTFTQCFHQALTNWLLEQKTKYDCLKED
ncbi:MAG: hypothetical protein ACRCW9_05880 [Cetobacterium sp.]